jgi:hypothetical protein
VIAATELQHAASDARKRQPVRPPCFVIGSAIFAKHVETVADGELEQIVGVFRARAPTQAAGDLTPRKDEGPGVCPALTFPTWASRFGLDSS